MTRNREGTDQLSGGEDCAGGSVSVASASSDTTMTSDATEAAAPPLATTTPHAAIRASVVQLLIQALEALQQPSAAVPASGTYYKIRMSVGDLGEWLEFKKQQQQEARIDQ